MYTGLGSEFTARMRTHFKKAVNKKSSARQRRLDKKFQVHHNTICRQLAKMVIRRYKREKKPKYTKEQAERSQELCRKLAYLLYHSDCSVVMDYEKYFTFDGSFMPRNDFYSDDRAECPDDVRFAGLEKFPKKYSSVFAFPFIQSRFSIEQSLCPSIRPIKSI